LRESVQAPPPRHRLAELIGALSLATDGANGLPPETALRTALVATLVARAAGLDEAAVHEAYWTALLRFIGCTAYAHETAARYGAGDDQSFLRALTVADVAQPVDLLRQAARGLEEASLWRRTTALLRLTTDTRPGDALAAAHCGLATTLAARLGLADGVVGALGQVYERFDGRGSPHRLAGDAITATARLVILAFRVVTHHAIEGRDAAVAVVRARSGGELDPRFASAFGGVAGEVMAAIDRASVWELFLDAEPVPRREVPAAELGRVAAAFADYSDLKSPFTLGHSHGVAALAETVAAAVGLSAEECRQLHVAALLHDLGRVAVPNGIWDKPGPLSLIERERAESHAWHTARILARTPLFAGVSAIAGVAHERLDGGGYPRAAALAASPPAARILAACDVFHALGEARPHRPAHDRAAAAAVLGDEARAGRLDARVVDAVLAVAGAPPLPPVELPDGLTAREAEVLCLVARGLSNKEVAARLDISAKTVQHHVAHIYEKTGVRTRAAAAIYAVARQLLHP
jgi:HD-GYP domain-containing protein (c-di-GMP phosphodiesterase class II)